MKLTTTEKTAITLMMLYAFATNVFWWGTIIAATINFLWLLIKDEVLIQWWILILTGSIGLVLIGLAMLFVLNRK